MANYYAVERSENYLMHYGIKGMQWRIRKAQKKGNMRKLNKYRRKAIKRLERYEKQANNKDKYAGKAIRKTAGVITAGSKMLVGVTNPSILVYKAGMAGYNAYRAANTKNAAEKAQKWRDEIKEDFGLDAVYTSKKKKSRRL